MQPVTHLRWLIFGLIITTLACRITPEPGKLNATPLPVQATPSIQPLVTPTGTASPRGEDQTVALLPGLELPVGLPGYMIDLSIATNLRSFDGHEQVAYINTEGRKLDSLYFRLLPNGGLSYGTGSISVSRTLVDGKLVNGLLSEGDTVLQVDLDGGLNPGDSVEVAFDFQGRVPLDYGGDRDPYAYGIYNLTEGVLALSGWYPILAVYDDMGWHLDPVSALGDSVFSEMAWYTVHVSAPEDLVFASTGVETKQETKEGFTQHWLVSGPARDFFMVASPNYQVQSERVSGTLVNSYSLPGSGSAGDSALKIASESLRMYNQHFGRYPYTELDVVEAPMRNALGVEYPEIVMIGESLYPSPDDPSFQVTVAHEVAHQWWYNLVGNDVFAEPWLDEGLASFTSSLYLEGALGEEAYQGLFGYWQGRYDTLVADGKDDQITRSLEHFERLGEPEVYSGVVYVKSALFFKAVREMIGDQAFFAALHQYFTEKEYGVATAKDLLSAFEQASGKTLDELYQKWLY
jgi:hypothetical protein